MRDRGDTALTRGRTGGRGRCVCTGTEEMRQVQRSRFIFQARGPARSALIPGQLNQLAVV